VIAREQDGLERLQPRVCEYRFTKSHASCTCRETAASPNSRTSTTLKQSLCFTSIELKAHPSESMPTKNSLDGRNSFNFDCGSSAPASFAAIAWYSPD